MIEYQKEIQRLREIIGSWRRLAQNKAPRRECMKEGYSRDYYGSFHYKVYSVSDIPGDLPIKEVLKEIQTNFLPQVYPYQFKRIDYSRKLGWLVEVRNLIEIDMDCKDSITKQEELN